jgi:hypothetical protein
MGPLWAPRGQRLPGQVPYGHGKTMTFLAALRCDRIDAPWCSTGQSMAKASGSMLSTCWSRRWLKATSS